jgi:hypothetical protein
MQDNQSGSPRQIKISMYKMAPLPFFAIFFMLMTVAIISLINVPKEPLLGLFSAIWFGGIALSSLRSWLLSRKNYVTVSENGIELKHSAGVIQIPWSEIKTVCLQIILTKVITWYGQPQLALQLSTQNINKINEINSSNSGGLYRKRDDLADLIGENKLDLYINMYKATEEDAAILNILKRQPSFVEHVKPLIKTKSLEEYNKVYEENFNSK